jgi:hypothetical protein
MEPSMKRLARSLLLLALAGCDRRDDDDPPPPATPTSLAAAAVSNARIDLSWTDNSDNELGFFIEQSSDGTAFVPVADAPAGATTASIAGLAPSTTYFFRVRAYHSESAGAYSNVAATTTDPVSWTLAAPSGTPPAPRAEHAAAAQPGVRMVVFSGTGATPYEDVWALDLSATPSWTEITPATGPGWRGLSQAVYDEGHQRMIVFGGDDGTFANNSVWALSLGATPAWSELLPSDPSPATPGFRVFHSLVYDAANQRAILFGGNGMSGELNDLWSLSLSGTPFWTRIWPAGTVPPTRCMHSAIYDAVGQRMIVFGGVSEAANMNDTWSLSLSGTTVWTKLTPAGSPPPLRNRHSAVYDSANRRMFVFGGESGSPADPLLSDLWVLTLSGPLEWHPVFAGGTIPTEAVGRTAVYDPAGPAMILFGGYDSSDFSTANNEVWRLGL